MLSEMGWDTTSKNKLVVAMAVLKGYAKFMIYKC